MYKNKDKNMAYISIIAIVAIVGMFIMFFSTAKTTVEPDTGIGEDMAGQAIAGFKDTKSMGEEKLGLWPPEDCDFFWNGGSYEIYECDGGIYYECSGGDCREI